MKRILIGGILGGIVVFAWGFVSHMFLGIGEMGFSQLADEQTVFSALADTGAESGLYYLPAMPEGELSDEAMQAAMERVEAGPDAFVVYAKEGTPGFEVQLGFELASSILAALVVGIVIVRLPSYGTRLLAVLLMGLFGWLSVSVSHWTWYRFPSAYATGELIDQVMGWFAAGIVMAGIVKEPPSE